jgi:hypothetical protein
MPKTHELLELLGRGRVRELESLIDRSVVRAESKLVRVTSDSDGGRVR